MKIRTVSWEIILAGLLLTGVAIYVMKSSHSNDSRDQTNHSFVTEKDSAKTIIIDLHNLNSLSQLDQLDKLDKLDDNNNEVKTIVLDLGFFKKTIQVPENADVKANRNLRAKLDSTLKSIPSDSLSKHPELVANLSHHVLTMTSSSFKAVPSSETLIQSKTFSAKGLKSISLDTKGGRIQAIGSSEGEVNVFITSKKGTSKEDFNKKYTVSMKTEGGVLNVSVDQHSSGWAIFNWLTGNNDTPGNIIVEMPQGLSLNAESKGGRISCEHLRNGIDIKTLGGRLTLNDIYGSIQAKTLGGEIEAHNLKGSGSLKSMGGSIVVGNASGTMDIKTAGGNISLDNMQGGPIDAETAGGNISAHFKTLTSDLTLKTAGGNINATLPESLKANLDLKGMRVSVPSHWSISGSFDSSHINGSVNGGSNLKVTAHTSAGNVTIE